MASNIPARHEQTGGMKRYGFCAGRLQSMANGVAEEGESQKKVSSGAEVGEESEVSELRL